MIVVNHATAAATAVVVGGGGVRNVGGGHLFTLHAPPSHVHLGLHGEGGRDVSGMRKGVQGGEGLVVVIELLLLLLLRGRWWR